MAGNVVMVKHAECVPQCAIAFERLWLEAGAPTGIYTNLRIVAAAARRNMKKSTMELGGNDAFIVLEDADLEKTVAWAVWARTNNTGQCCVAGKRFVVVEALADQFARGSSFSSSRLAPLTRPLNRRTEGG